MLATFYKSSFLERNLVQANRTYTLMVPSFHPTNLSFFTFTWSFTLIKGKKKKTKITEIRNPRKSTSNFPTRYWESHKFTVKIPTYSTNICHNITLTPLKRHTINEMNNLQLITKIKKTQYPNFVTLIDEDNNK